MAETQPLRIPIGLDTKDVQSDARGIAKTVREAFDTDVMKKPNKELQQIAYNMKQTLKQVTDLSAELEVVKNTEIPTEQFKQYQEAAEEAKLELLKLDAAAEAFLDNGGKETDPFFQGLVSQADAMVQKLNAAEEKMNELKASGKAFTIDTEKAEQLNDKLDTTTDKLKIQYGNYKDIVNKQKEQVKSHTRIFDIVKQVTSEIKKQPSIMKKVGSLIKQAVLSASKLASHIKKVASHGNAAATSFKKLAGTMLGVTLGAQGIVSMLRKIVSLGKEGFTNLTKESTQAANSLNLLTGKFMQLKNSVGAALAPLVSMVTPVISRIIDLFTKAFNSVAMFFGALSGKDTIMVAKSLGASEGAVLNAKSGSGGSSKKTPEEKYQEAVAKAQAQYDKELARYQEKVAKNEEKQAKAAAKLAKEQEKANGQLAGFDELNNLNIDTMDDAIDTMDEFSLEEPVLELPDMSDFLDEVGEGMGPMFEEVKIDSKFNDLIEWLKDMWDKADFTELGKKAGEALKKFLDDVPWDKIQKNAEKVGKSLATLINGFVEVDGLGTSIGKTFAEGLNTIFHALDAFVSNLHWESVGKFIADTLNGWFENIDWELIRHTFVTGFRGLADGIQSFIENFHWDNISTAISNVVNIVVESLYEFFSHIDFYQLGYNIQEQITKTIEKIDWQKIGETLGVIIQSAIDFLHGIIDAWQENDTGTKIKEAIKSFFKGVIEKIDFKELGEVIGKIIQGAIDFIKDLILEWREGETGKKIKGALKDFFEGLCENVDMGEAAAILAGIFATKVAAALIPALAKKGLSSMISNLFTKEAATVATTTATEAGTAVGEAAVTGATTAIEGGAVATGAALTGMAAVGVGAFGVLAATGNKYAEDMRETLDTYEIDQYGDTLEGLKQKFSDTADVITGKCEEIREKSIASYGDASASAALYSETSRLQEEAIQNVRDAEEQRAQAMANLTMYETDQNQLIREGVMVSDELRVKIDEARHEVETTTEAYNIANGTLSEVKDTMSFVVDQYNATSEVVSTYSKEYADEQAKIQMANNNLKGDYSTTSSEVIASVDTMKTEVSTKITEMNTGLGESGISGADTYANNFIAENTTRLADYTQSGTDVGEGFQSGVESSSEATFSWWGTFFQSLIDAAKSIFDSHSPSVVMNNIGIDVFTGLLNGFKSMGPMILDWITELISNIVGGISNGLSEISTAISSITSAIEEPFNDIISSAMDWGKDIVGSIAEGIRSGISSVVSAVKSVASTIRSYLHFSEPDIGPLSNFHTFMPDMIDSMVYGIEKGIPDVERALDRLSYGIASGTQLSPNMMRSMTTSASSALSKADMYDTMRQAFVDAMQSSERSNEDIVVQIDQTEIFRAVKSESVTYNKQTGLSAFA